MFNVEKAGSGLGMRLEVLASINWRPFDPETTVYIAVVDLGEFQGFHGTPLSQLYSIQTV